MAGVVANRFALHCERRRLNGREQYGLCCRAVSIFTIDSLPPEGNCPFFGRRRRAVLRQLLKINGSNKLQNAWVYRKARSIGYVCQRRIEYRFPPASEGTLVGLYRRKESRFWWMSYTGKGDQYCESTKCRSKALANTVLSKREGSRLQPGGEIRSG